MLTNNSLIACPPVVAVFPDVSVALLLAELLKNLTPTVRLGVDEVVLTLII